jgi:predicted metalloprotease
MRWKGRKVSGNMEDRRYGGRSTSSGGVFSGLPIPKGKIGIVVIVIVLLFTWVSGGNPLELLLGSENQLVKNTEKLDGPTTQEDELAEFVGVVLADTESVWNHLFHSQGKEYKEPNLVLFNGSVNSACGNANTSVGPFYCSGDDRIYIDLSFYDDLRNKLDAPGDFAMAYVIAHEVGHHVQHVLGISDIVHEKRKELSEIEYNKLSVRLELQADFFAGVWAHHAQRMNNILEEGDIEEALQAANAIGDDRLQKRGRGIVVPDSFTHGTSEQRVRWFTKGFKTGDINQGDTFAAKKL